MKAKPTYFLDCQSRERSAFFIFKGEFTMARITIKKSVLLEYMRKSGVGYEKRFGKGADDRRFKEFQKRVLAHLDSLEKDRAELKKSLIAFEATCVQKAGYPVGTIREWKGRKYIKVAQGKWRPKYDSHSRGAKMAIALLKKKASACTDSRELLQLILENRERFSDAQGRPLPFVRELSDYVSTLNDKLEGGRAEPKTDYKALQEEFKEEIASGKRNNTKELKEDVDEWKNLIASGGYKGEHLDHLKEIVKIGEAELKRRNDEAGEKRAKKTSAKKGGSGEEKGGDDGKGKGRKTGYAATLRQKLKENLKDKLGTYTNKKTGIKARLSGDSINKMSSEKAVEKSKANGFSIDQHFEVANKIVELFENADLVETRPDKKASPDLKSIKRFDSDVKLNGGTNAIAHITVKESVENGHKIYSVEVMELNKNAADEKPTAGGEISKTPTSTSTIPQSAEKVNQNSSQEATIESIREKYTGGISVDGDDDSITLPDGTELEGKWKLVEADAPSASHDERTFQKTEGFPTNADGSTINDRDYEHDSAAKEAVIDIASDFDSRALGIDNPVVVSEDGVVISGNNRTMSSKIAARKGTDKKYIAALEKKAKKFGFTSDDVAKFKNPRVVFETKVNGEYSTAQFAKFNESGKKAQSPVEVAVKVSKTVNAATVESVAGKINQYDTLGELYADNKAMQEVFGTLIDGNVIKKTDLPAYYTREGGVTNNGKEFLETVLIGSVISENNLRSLGAPGGKEIRQKLVRAIVPLVENKGMKGYSIAKELNEGVNIAIDIKKNKKFADADDYSRQGVLIGEKPDPIAVEFAKKLEGTQKEFAEFMRSLNMGLKPAANGEADIFVGGVESREEILSRYMSIRKSIRELFDSFFLK